MNNLSSLLGTYSVTVNNDGIQTVVSDNYNCTFDFTSGYMERWGKSKDIDDTPPIPEVCDFEVTTSCSGVNGVPCPFCSPAGTLVSVVDSGELVERPIEEVKTGDVVRTFNSRGPSKYADNVVEELYARPYSGELVVIETEGGRILKLTPDHEVMTKGRGWVAAGELSTEDELIGIDEVGFICSNCGLFASTFFSRGYCCEECFNEDNPLHTCGLCGKPHRAMVFCKECRDTMCIDAKHPLRATYDGMLRRCYDPKRNNYHCYGGRGISVDKDWHIFGNFVRDMYPSYLDGRSLDRIDNDKGYSKDNCRWATVREQRLNRRRFTGTSCEYPGVSRYHNRYKVEVRVNGVNNYLGLYPTIEEAVETRNNFLLLVDGSVRED